MYSPLSYKIDILSTRILANGLWLVSIWAYFGGLATKNMVADKYSYTNLPLLVIILY